MSTGAREVVSMIALALAACGGTAADVPVDSSLLRGADETASTTSDDLSGSMPAGTVLATTSDLNLRAGPGMSNRVLQVIPSGDHVTLLQSSPSGPWYNVSHQGTSGWAHGLYLRVVQSAPSTNPAPSAGNARDAAIARAARNVGFSYWWGHGRLSDSGPSSATRGSCTGSCPSCSHGGSYGADCSGYVAKIWQVPSSNTAMDVDQHPYSTWNFRNDPHGWHGVSRAAMQKGDALVYNSNGEGHIFLYESGDAWGSLWAYEAKGCSYGIVHDLRSAGSVYVPIARDGY